MKIATARAAATVLTTLAILAPSASASSFVTMKGVNAPGPAKYDKVRVLKQGSPKAKHVLVLAPGTSAGASYFSLVGADIVKRLPGWQVWSVERRENLLEDHSVLNSALAGKTSPKALFDYYLNWIGNPSITRHFQPVQDKDAGYVRKWGMSVAVGDLHNVIRAARKGGRKVVLGGHSLGGGIATAYATWDFHGRAGSKDLAGLVLIDGVSSAGHAPSTKAVRTDLSKLASSSPFLDLSGLGIPWAFPLVASVGATDALKQPNAPSLLQGWAVLPAALKPPVPVTNQGAFGYALDTQTGPKSLALSQMHMGSLAPSGNPRGWKDGELVPVRRAETMIAGFKNSDGFAWYHPKRLSLDSQEVNGGLATPGQKLLGVRAIHGRTLKIPIYAFETSLGKGHVLKGARSLARHAHLKRSQLTLVGRSSTTAHLDPLAASPSKNDFLKTVVPFLRKVK